MVFICKTHKHLTEKRKALKTYVLRAFLINFTDEYLYL